MEQLNDFQLFIKSNKLKQKQVAEYLGVSTQYINQVAKGKCALAGDKYELLAKSQWDVSMLDFPSYIKVPAATMTPLDVEDVEYKIVSNDKSITLLRQDDGSVKITFPPERIRHAENTANSLRAKGLTVELVPIIPSPTEAMKDGENVITDSEAINMSIVPAQVVEEIKEEVAREIEKEIIVPIVPHEIATKTDTNIRKYIEENESELAHFDPRTITAEVDIAETITTTSMSPIYMPNDKVFIKFLKEKTKITDGKIYYFDTRTRPTMVRMVKLLDDGRLLLRAANPRYGDIYLHKDEIINIGEIKSLFRDTFGDQYLEIDEVRRKKEEQIDKLVEQNGEALKIIHDLIKK